MIDPEISHPDEHLIKPIEPVLPDTPIIDEDIIGMASGDIINRIEVLEKYTKVKDEYGGRFYTDLIFLLTNIRMGEEAAREDWQNILRHKHFMSEKLGRNVGIRVAALDYYTNITRKMASPKIVDMREYTRTVKESITDPLTFCYNRRYFDYILKQLFRSSVETGNPLSLLMVDLDHFKAYNDNNGHLLGDFALIEAARIFNVITRKTDIVARYGGDEFAIVLPGSTLAQAVETAERIRCAVEDFRFPGEQNLPGKRLTSSIGAAELTPGIQERADFVKLADDALYSAKRAGRNQVASAPLSIPGGAA